MGLAWDRMHDASKSIFLLCFDCKRALIQCETASEEMWPARRANTEEPFIFFSKQPLDCQENISISFLGLVFWRRQTSVKHPVSEVYLADKIVCLVRKYLHHVYTFLLYMYESMRAMLKKQNLATLRPSKGSDMFFVFFFRLFQVVFSDWFLNCP